MATTRPTDDFEIYLQEMYYWYSFTHIVYHSYIHIVILISVLFEGLLIIILIRWSAIMVNNNTDFKVTYAKLEVRLKPATCSCVEAHINIYSYEYFTQAGYSVDLYDLM